MAKRSDYITWDEYFMGLAILASMRSKDPNTQVGCCIVGNDNRILSMGYNGFPMGVSDDDFPWEREGKCSYDTKYNYVVHAELNAILSFKGETLFGSTLYVNQFPCNECAKAIIQAGIKKVVYFDDKYAMTDGVKSSKRMFDAVGIEYRQFEKVGKNLSINL